MWHDNISPNESPLGSAQSPGQSPEQQSLAGGTRRSLADVGNTPGSLSSSEEPAMKKPHLSKTKLKMPKEMKHLNEPPTFCATMTKTQHSKLKHPAPYQQEKTLHDIIEFLDEGHSKLFEKYKEVYDVGVEVLSENDELHTAYNELLHDHNKVINGMYGVGVTILRSSQAVVQCSHNNTPKEQATIYFIISYLNLIKNNIRSKVPTLLVVLTNIIKCKGFHNASSSNSGSMCKSSSDLQVPTALVT